MSPLVDAWDYLILTASNEAQAAAYTAQLEVRDRLGLLGGVGRWAVVADPGGMRVGSGGSTICCLLEVLNHEFQGRREAAQPEAWDDLLRRLRILIIHAGGDSRRLPAYGTCGKVFIPLPGSSDSALGATLFDRQLPVYLGLPPLAAGSGQIVIAAGDVLLGFDPAEVSFASEGITGLGCRATPEQASSHGVYCAGHDGHVRQFLQKPSPAEQHRRGALSDFDQAVLDIGVINFDAPTALELLELCQVRPAAQGELGWGGPIAEQIQQHGLDFYREICCALGSDADLESYRVSVRGAGSAWSDAALAQVFRAMSPVPCRVQVLRHCDFLHFGTTRQIITSGQQLLRREDGFASAQTVLSINNRLAESASLRASDAWVEGCSIEERLTLSGGNVVVGVDVRQPLELPPRACLDVLPGRDRHGRPVFFVRCYRDDDRLHGAPPADATLGGYPLDRWLEQAQSSPEELWDGALPAQRRSAWNARLFPAEKDADSYRGWLWMFEPGEAVPEQFRRWREADRYSLEEMARLADQEAFHQRRVETRGTEIRSSLRRAFRSDSGFSAADLAHILAHSPDRRLWVAELLAEARWHWEHAGVVPAEEAFTFSRILHTLGSALLGWVSRQSQARWQQLLPDFKQHLPPAELEWLAELRLTPEAEETIAGWAEKIRQRAFDFLRREIIASGRRSEAAPHSALRSDEIVWCRAPARLDLTGGWTDTPPFSLEHGGSVLNAAVDLNGQPPIQVYARVVPEPVVRLRSIDVGSQRELCDWESLVDYNAAEGEFSLVKAALVQSGIAPNGRLTLAETLAAFGGGLEITTLAAIPKGSGLGTSSIMGAVVTAAIARTMGRRLSQAQLFHAVLRLEQALTTGGGWQDQIGGSVGGLKLITTRPGLVPDASIRYVPADVLDPVQNGGRTLLYYTGITRLAKNILQQVVGHYLDRDRPSMTTLRQLRALAGEMTETIGRKNFEQFGRLIDTAWQLNKRLDPNATSPAIEELLDRVKPHVYGAKLLGAGGGGFLLLVCKSSAAADRVRADLADSPPNDRARFFEFALSHQGLAVSAC
jgi:galactokinase/mevalonate kinase-like predicted kinase